MRDFLPEDVRRRQYVIGVIADVYQKYGFEPLETPAVENLETLQGKYGEEGDRLIFKILKRGEGAETGQADLALRYDVTVPLARVVAEYRAKLPKFFKRYQIQPVWRADRPQKGRFREFYQCDVDAIGSTSMTVEAELLSAAADVFAEAWLQGFQIVVNHRKLLNAVLAHAGVPAELHGAALVIMDKADKIGVDGVRKELGEHGLAADERRQHAARTAERHAAGDLAHGWTQPSPDAQRRRQGWHSRICGRSSRSAEHQRRAAPALDRSLARGLSYYTGPIFEIRVADLAGSLGGGGRYDNLIGMFSGEDIPASGISLGLERILVVMGERNMFPAVGRVDAGRRDGRAVVRESHRSLSVVRDRVAQRRDCASSSIRKRRPKTARRSATSSSSMRRRAASHLWRSSVPMNWQTATVTVKNMKTGEQTIHVPRAEAVKWLSN